MIKTGSHSELKMIRTVILSAAPDDKNSMPPLTSDDKNSEPEMIRTASFSEP